jgi:hypothetical protein
MMWGREGLYGRPGVGGVLAFPTWEHREQDAGDHKGLVKIPRIFLAPPLLTTLAPTDVDELSVRLMPITAEYEV